MMLKWFFVGLAGVLMFYLFVFLLVSICCFCEWQVTKKMLDDYIRQKYMSAKIVENCFMTFEEWNKEFFLPYADSIGIQMRPYKRAYWIMGDGTKYDDGKLNIMHCSNCKALFRYQGRKKNINYCYRCGSVMEGVKNGKIRKSR